MANLWLVTQVAINLGIIVITLGLISLTVFMISMIWNVLTKK